MGRWDLVMMGPLFDRRESYRWGRLTQRAWELLLLENGPCASCAPAVETS